MKKLQKLVLKTLQESGVTVDDDEFKTTLAHKVRHKIIQPTVSHMITMEIGNHLNFVLCCRSIQARNLLLMANTLGWQFSDDRVLKEHTVQSVN